jgi:hypothetical protein
MVEHSHLLMIGMVAQLLPKLPPACPYIFSLAMMLPRPMASLTGS